MTDTENASRDAAGPTATTVSSSLHEPTDRDDRPARTGTPGGPPYRLVVLLWHLARKPSGPDDDADVVDALDARPSSDASDAPDARSSSDASDGKRSSDAPDGTARPAARALSAGEHAALTTALRLRDELGTTLTAVVLGDDGACSSARIAAQAGCDHTVCIGEPAELQQMLVDLDYLTLATALGAALGRIGCDILLCADRSIDELQGILGPTLAEFLEVPHLTGVVAVTVDRQAETHPIVATHQGGQAHHRFRCTPPVVLCVLADQAGQASQASHRLQASQASQTYGDAAGQASAHDPPAPDLAAIEKLTLGDLGVDLGEPGSPIGVPAPHVRRPPVMADAAGVVAHLLAEHLLP